MSAREDISSDTWTSPIGIFRPKQPGLKYAGLCVPVGPVTAAQLRGVAALAGEYGDGEIRTTPGQNLIIPKSVWMR